VTKTAETNEAGRQDYTEENPDPRFRPSVSRLLGKLRELPQMDDPRAVAFIVDDLVYRRLVRDDKRPTELWYLTQQMVSYWKSVLGAGGASDLANERQLIFASFAISRDAVPEMSSLLLDKDLKKSVRKLVIDHTFAPRTMKKSDRVIPACSCGNEYEFLEQWGNHVRNLIWKELRDAGPGSTGEVS
jgi:hypothetical protein